MSTRAANQKKQATTLSGLSNQLLAKAQLAPSAGTMSLDDLIKTADEWQKLGKVQDVDALYKNWIQLSDSPYKFVACFNYGVLLATWGRDDDAIAVYQKAIDLNQAFSHARINLGLAMERKGRPDEALRAWREVIENPVVAQAAGIDMKTTALNHIGRLLETQRNYHEAEDALTKSLALNPGQSDAIHHWFHLRQKQCEWPSLVPLPGVTENKILNSMSPLAALAFDDDPAFQMHVAAKIVRDKFSYSVQSLAEKRNYGHTRIKIGYLSGDLCTHAVGLILPELFELHDRSSFEVFAYDYSREDGSALRERYKHAIENFRSIKPLSDAQAAQLIRADEIDILVDLHGLSLGLRAEIMARRPAPIQATYLGYIGTTMMPYIDYVITDKYCFYDGLAKYYSEAPIYLDCCCLPTDRKKQVEQTPTKKDIGLPEDKFIFATFNNSYKLNEGMFKSWMNLLRKTSDSILWIVDDNPWATKNLKTFAEKCGIDANRLVFTPRVHPQAYLARMPLVDVFLDNHPYNAGSTASDILWMGVPMVTLSGRTFVSRMAGSMLYHAGLGQLIANTHEEYEAIAIRLYSNASERENVRKKLQEQRASGGAFDMQKFTKSVEQNYKRLMSAL